MDESKYEIDRKANREWIGRYLKQLHTCVFYVYTWEWIIVGLYIL